MILPRREKERAARLHPPPARRRMTGNRRQKWRG
jgi:hypothetical protein